jgi:hypothetical protein
MDLNEFIRFRKNCVVCSEPNRVVLQGVIQETLGEDDEITVVYHFSDCLDRKKFITFATQKYLLIPGSDLDPEMYNTDKFSSFVLGKDGYVEFDREFQFRMRLALSSACPHSHYSYTSRKIKITGKSMDISRGYPVVTEELRCGGYRVICNSKADKTFVYNLEVSNDPIVIPYRDIANFPHDDQDKFVKKLQNIMLLA